MEGKVRAWAAESARPSGSTRRVALALEGEGRPGLERLRSTLASYGGHLRHGASRREWGTLWRREAWLRALFAREAVWVPTPRWSGLRVGRAPTFAHQYRELTRGAGRRLLVFCPVGSFVEFRGRQRILAETVLGLKVVPLRRGGFAFAVGFPRRLVSAFSTRALERGVAVAMVRTGDPGPGSRCASRRITEVRVPTLQRAAPSGGGARPDLQTDSGDRERASPNEALLDGRGDPLPDVAFQGGEGGLKTGVHRVYP